MGICILYVGSLNINESKSRLCAAITRRGNIRRRAKMLNNLITLMIFLITAINVVIASFGNENVFREEENYDGMISQETLKQRRHASQMHEVDDDHASRSELCN